MNVDLSGRVAVVTGASRGVGQHIAETLATFGARLALAARSEGALRRLEEQLRARGLNAKAFPTDISQPQEIERLKQEVTAQLGPPTILVNAAGVFGPFQFIKDSDPVEWVETLMINTVAPYLTCRAFVGEMIAQGWGRIVNVTSAAALHPPGPLNSAYATSKAALNQFTRHLAAELGGTGVTANVIHPGDVKTEMWADIRNKVGSLGPAGVAYQTWVAWVEETGGDPPGKAAELVARLMSDEAAGVNGQFLWIEAGLQAPLPSWGEPVSSLPWLKR